MVWTLLPNPPLVVLKLPWFVFEGDAMEIEDDDNNSNSSIYVNTPVISHSTHLSHSTLAHSTQIPQRSSLLSQFHQPSVVSASCPSVSPFISLGCLRCGVQATVYVSEGRWACLKLRQSRSLSLFIRLDVSSFHEWNLPPLFDFGSSPTVKAQTSSQPSPHPLCNKKIQLTEL